MTAPMTGAASIGLPVEELQTIIRDVPKPVIARVNGFAIGGGNVLVTCCDLAIASSTAVFGQVGPKVGSVDPGFGTALLGRVVGEKKAREIWMLCRRYTAQQALEMGLVNTVVEPAELDAEVERWCAEIAALSPTAIAIAKRSFNQDFDFDPRHFGDGHAGAEPVLPDRGIARRGEGVPGKAQAEIPLEHDPEKWEPVFGKDHAPTRDNPKGWPNARPTAPSKNHRRSRFALDKPPHDWRNGPELLPPAPSHVLS